MQDVFSAIIFPWCILGLSVFAYLLDKYILIPRMEKRIKHDFHEGIYDPPME